MADIEVQKVLILCDVCWGKGTTEKTIGIYPDIQVIAITCPQCAGKKYKFWGWIYDDKTTIEDPKVPMP